MVISSRGRGFFERITTPMVKMLGKVGITPNLLTAAGVILTAAATYYYSLAAADKIHFISAGLFLVVGSLLDGLDGHLARLTGRQSDLGAFVDSVADRISDTLIVVGFVLTGYVNGFLGVLMLSSSMLVSYARARGEALNVSLKNVGVGERAVRLVLAVLGTFLAYLHPLALTLTAVAVTVVSALTAAQRAAVTVKMLSRRER